MLQKTNKEVLDYIDDKQVRIDPKYGITIIGDNSQEQILKADGTCTEDTLIGYLEELDDGTEKYGQLGENKENLESYIGSTSAKIWQDSYLSHRRAMGSGLTLKHIFVCSRKHWKNIKDSKKIQLLIDDALRSLIRKKYNNPIKSKKIPFSALVYPTQTSDEYRNKENLVGYDHNDPVHFAILKNSLKELLNIEQDTIDVIKFVERVYQEGDVELLIKLLKKYRKILLNAYTSYGKSLISTAVAIRTLEANGGGFIIVTTPRTDTLGDFETNATKFDFGTKKNVIVITQKDIKKWPATKIQKAVAQGYVVMLLVSVQGIRAKSKSNDIQWGKQEINKYKKFFDICDVWIRDEKWIEYGGVETRKLMKELEGRMMLIDLAATSSKIKDDYESEAVIDRSLFWAMKNRKLTQLPELGIDGIYYSGLKVIDKLLDVYDVEEGFDPRKLPVPNVSFTDFAHRSVLETLPDYFYRENALAKKLGISIIDDPDLPEISKRVGLIVLPEGSKDWPADMYMPKLSKLWNELYKEKYNELYISAYELEKLSKEYDTTNDCINDLLNKYQRIIILTHRKYTVGTSIDHIGHIILLDNIGSDDLFEQLIGRILRLVLEGKVNVKTLVKVKAMVPNLVLKSTLAKMVVEHSDKVDTPAQAKEYFDLLGFKAYDVSGKPQQYPGEEIMDELAKQRLVVSGSGLKPSEVQEYLSDPKIVSAWQTANLPRIKSNGSIDLSLTDDNKSKINKKKKQQSIGKNKNLTEETIRVLMNETFAMLKIISYCTNEQDVKSCLKSKIAQEYFGKDVVSFLLNEKTYLTMIQNRLDAIFKNKKLLKTDNPETYAEIMLRANGFTDKKSIAFMPFGIVDDDLKHFKNYADHPFIVVNPLNGSMPNSVRKNFPNAEIICVDTFGLFTTDLTDKGYTCYTNIGDIPKMKKRPVLLINAPYTSGTQDATNKYGAQIENAVTKLNPIAVLNIAPDNFLTGEGTNQKIRNQMIAKYGKPVYIKWLNQSQDWNKTIKIDTELTIWDENSEHKTTQIKSRFERNQYDIKLTDLIIPSETKEEYEYILSIQTTKKCRVKGFSTTGEKGPQIKLKTGDKFDVIQGEEFDSNNHLHRQVVGYLRSESLADVPPGPSIPGSYRELVSDYSPCSDANISKKFGDYMRSKHTRWLVNLRYNSRSLDSPALSLVPMINLKDLSDNFTDQDIYDLFGTPQTIIDKIEAYGSASPY